MVLFNISVGNRFDFPVRNTSLVCLSLNVFIISETYIKSDINARISLNLSEYLRYSVGYGDWYGQIWETFFSIIM